MRKEARREAYLQKMCFKIHFPRGMALIAIVFFKKTLTSMYLFIYMYIGFGVPGARVEAGGGAAHGRAARCSLLPTPEGWRAERHPPARNAPLELSAAHSRARCELLPTPEGCHAERVIYHQVYFSILRKKGGSQPEGWRAERHPPARNAPLERARPPPDRQGAGIQGR